MPLVSPSWHGLDVTDVTLILLHPPYFGSSFTLSKPQRFQDSVCSHHKAGLGRMATMVFSSFYKLDIQKTQRTDNGRTSDHYGGHNAA